MGSWLPRRYSHCTSMQEMLYGIPGIQLELELGRNMQNRKGFPKYTGNKRNAQNSIHSLPLNSDTRLKLWRMAGAKRQSCHPECPQQKASRSFKHTVTLINPVSLLSSVWLEMAFRGSPQRMKLTNLYSALDQLLNRTGDLMTKHL